MIVVHLSVSPRALPQLIEIFTVSEIRHTQKKTNKQGKQELEPTDLNSKELFHSFFFV
jgi:hypothetical protein